jgi:hypothetical protein
MSIHLKHLEKLMQSEFVAGSRSFVDTGRSIWVSLRPLRKSGTWRIRSQIIAACVDQSCDEGEKNIMIYIKPRYEVAY